MGRFVDLTPPVTGWDSELYYFVCTIHRALQFAPDASTCDPYQAVCDAYTVETVRGFDPLVPTMKWVTYSKGAHPTDRWTIVSIRGTDTTAQWQGNFLRLAQATDARIRGRVHGYFLDAALRLYTQIGAALRADIGNGQVLFTGHSLGAALATLLAWLVKADNAYAPAAVIGLGSPRVGNPAFANPLEFQPCPVIRLENSGDVFATVPPPEFCVPAQNGWGPLYPLFLSYRHVGRGYHVSYHSVRLESDWHGSTPAAYGLRSANSQGVSEIFDLLIPHSNTEYCKRIRNTIPRYVQQPLSAPGEFRQIDLDHLDEVNRNISSLTGETFRPSF